MTINSTAMPRAIAKGELYKMFLAYDGDKVGRKLESLLIDNDELKVEAYANEVSNALRTLESALIERGCTIIFASGDSLLAKSTEQFAPDKIQRNYGGISFSLGVGGSPLEAMLALKKAKANGHGSYCIYGLEDHLE